MCDKLDEFIVSTDGVVGKNFVSIHEFVWNFVETNYKTCVIATQLENIDITEYSFYFLCCNFIKLLIWYL